MSEPLSSEHISDFIGRDNSVDNIISHMWTGLYNYRIKYSSNYRQLIENKAKNNVDFLPGSNASDLKSNKDYFYAITEIKYAVSGYAWIQGVLNAVNDYLGKRETQIIPISEQQIDINNIPRII